MKKFIKYIFLIMCLVISRNLAAQSNKEKIQDLRVTIVAREVKLTPQEAKIFWPVYNEWQDKLDALKQNRKEFKKVRENPESFTDKEVEAYLSSELYVRQKEAELFKEYNDKLKRILPLKKVALVYRAEEEFKKELIRQIKETK